MNSFLSPVFLYFLGQFLITCVSSLECYVCDKQDGNTEKCLKTIKTCEYEEDRCLSEIRWSTTPYWTQGAEKQYYVSKVCATEAICDKKIKDSMELCHYIWYEDWKCAECCQGDRCNYYVTLGSSNVSSSVVLILLSVTLAMVGMA
eukprot:GFUD01022708.1.p1 GENE.GFUD01022708.1~~GFUD01022708.1.p1  ORF type:complete len:146 (+),score=25.26 GFUD01022708.1:81-518(+)